MTMLHIEKSEHCISCKKTYDQHEYDMQYCTICWSKNHRYPDFVDIRRISEKPTGLEIVFGDVDTPIQRYTRADERAEMQAAIRELQSMVEIGIYYARKNDGGINDAEAMSRVLNNTKKWCE